MPRNQTNHALLAGFLFFLLALILGMAPPVAAAVTPISGMSPYPDGGDAEDPAKVTLCNGEFQFGVLYRNSETEPHLAVNPTDPDNMIAGWHQDRWSTGGAQGVGGAYTSDGGETWTQFSIPFTRCSGGAPDFAGDYGRASDPWISFGPDGVAYYMALVFDFARSRNGMAVATSTDGGATWSDPVLIKGIESHDQKGRAPFHDKNTITADPYHPGVVYATWVIFQNRSQLQLFSRSVDWGKTWHTTPVNHREVIGRHARTDTRQGSQIAVLPDGTLINAFVRFVDDPRKQGSFLGVEEAFFRSRNQGRTWERLDGKIGDLLPFVVQGFEIYNAVDAEYQLAVRDASWIPDIAVDRKSGNIYAVWQDSRFNAAGLIGSVISRSTDRGNTWSDPVPVNIFPNPLAQGFLPTVAVSEDGAVGVLYYDFRNDVFGDATLDTDVHLAVFDPELNRLGEVRLTEASFDMRQMLLTDFRYFPGDYMGLDTAGNDFVAAFTVANNLGLPVDPFQEAPVEVDTHNRQDIVFARVAADSWSAPTARHRPPVDLRPMPPLYALYPNAPNPVTGRTSIRFDLPQAGSVRLDVFDVAGRRVRALVEEDRGAGQHVVTWDGRDDRGEAVSSGIYLYRLLARGFSETRRMVLVR